MLMGILLRETDVRDHGDRVGGRRESTRGWPSSIGISNMQRGAFADAQRRAGGRLDDHEWPDLACSDGLAIDAAAWKLRDLQDQIRGEPELAGDGMFLVPLELTAIGYNTGSANMSDVAKGKHVNGPAGRKYLRAFRKVTRAPASAAARFAMLTA